jgi:hypothetical protein
MKVFFRLIPLGRFLPLACMITVIPMPKENQDASETVSLLPKVPYNQSAGKEAEEDLWISLLPEGVKQRQQCSMETAASQLLP